MTWRPGARLVAKTRSGGSSRPKAGAASGVSSPAPGPTTLGSDTRFIVTNFPGGRAKHLCETVYCARGRMENLIKEHKLDLRSDRTSCHRREANQFRIFLHTAAYGLMLRRRGAAPKKSQWRNATPSNRDTHE